MLDIESTQLSDKDRELIAHQQVGGLIIFSRNFESADQILTLTNQIREVNDSIIIAVDQEGGRVQRFKDGFSRLPSLAKFGRLAEQNLPQAKDFAHDLGELMALEVQAVGCDISFAPVLDLGFETSQVIGDRGFSTKVEPIVQLGSAYISGMKKGGMRATGKHFPGHGSVEADSHFAIPYDDRELETIKNNDLVPFARLAEELGAVMPAHIVYSKVDSQPAGFSQVWLQTILRQELGFDGVIFSDDLSMKGAEAAGDYGQRARSALDAGCDMVLVCNDREAALKVLAELEGYPTSPKSNQRLNSLRMSSSPTGLAELKLSDRWQQLSARLNEFNNLF
ncbi:beta-N-acetylhexosaminidase [Aliikangiella coralliicola]|uniref:Beta-hexosaminidase n=2 Tax=Aliikangiella coralliicola TaxID=2592383 RepID=A0A545U547_9GAMM|nr:beta-N-acetylhexosaminidase [Aliikangiella coralliicola]